MSWVKVGEGLNASNQNISVEGILKEIRVANDTLKALEENPSNLIVLVRTAGVTVVTPIISMIKGIICTKGGTSSHLAIVSRDFKIPCIMATKISPSLSLDGKKIMMRTNHRKGFVYASEGH